MRSGVNRAASLLPDQRSVEELEVCVVKLVQSHSWSTVNVGSMAKVTSCYADSRKACTRTLKGKGFVCLALQHNLSGGFHRVKDRGFLHGSIKRTLALVQYVLRIKNGDDHRGNTGTYLAIGIEARLDPDTIHAVQGAPIRHMTKPLLGD